MKSLSILLILYCSLCTFQCNYLKNVLFTPDNQTSNIADYSKYTVNDFLSQLLNETYDNNKQPSYATNKEQQNEQREINDSDRDVYRCVDDKRTMERDGFI